MRVFLVFVLLLPTLGACDQLLPDDTGTASGAAYLEISATISSGCPSIRLYSDDNPRVPDNPAWREPYGPVEAGTFSGRYTWGVGSVPIQYTLAEPPSGVSRTYKFTLRVYKDATLNRCVSNAGIMRVTQSDRPL